MLVSVKKCSNNYYKACLYAYLCDFKNFSKYFGLLNIPEDELITFYIVKGIRFSLDFAKGINSMKSIRWNRIIGCAISARFIMSDYLEDDIIKRIIPSNIWYPNSPSKNTCLLLLDKHETYKYIVATLSIINNWSDILNKCNLCRIESTVHIASEFFNRFKNILPKNDPFRYYNPYNYDTVGDDIKDVYYKGDNRAFQLLFDGFNFIFQRPENNPDIFLYEEDVFELSDYFSFNNIGLVNDVSVDLNLIRLEKYLDVDDVKCINEDTVKFNILNSIYVLNNKEKFNDEICRLALTNYLVSGYYDKELVDIYKPFYLYSYRLPNIDILNILLENHKELEYNVYLVYSILDEYTLIEKYDILPDFDLLDFAFRSGSIKFYESLLNKARKIGFIYKHLDFKNKTIYVEPLKFSINDLNKYFKNDSYIKLEDLYKYFKGEHPLLCGTGFNFP